MPSSVTIHITAGPTQGEQFSYTDRTTVLIGRDDECHIRFPKDREHQTISRHHCLLDINPPDVRIRDLGSRTGTYIDGRLIGKRDKHQSAQEGAHLQFAEFTLHDGDEIRLGKVSMHVRVHLPIQCVDCCAEIPDEHKQASALPSGAHRCLTCWNKPNMDPTVDHTLNPNVCMRCGADVSASVGSARSGELICDHCQANPAKLAQRMLDQAHTGNSELLSIQGYRIEKELGQGGMGAVYLAIHEQTGEHRALKVMLPQVAANRRMRELFLREVSITRFLNHPHVVRLHDLGCSEGMFFFTMEYCEGGSISDWIKRTGQPLPIITAVRLITQALDGAEYAHHVELRDIKLADGSTMTSRGVVHRDISPHNIFLSRVDNGYVAKVGDYGLAKAFDLAGLSGLSMTGVAAGKPVYMPRQQLIDYKYARPEVDVWALAATLYYMVSLHYPRDFPRGSDPWQIVLQTDAIPISKRVPVMPTRLAEVIDTALRDRPEIGFKTAGELKKALVDALS